MDYTIKWVEAKALQDNMAQSTTNSYMNILSHILDVQLI
jgi:hypothetical protein